MLILVKTMTIKKIKIIGFFAIFILTVIFHFLYEFLPNPIFSILFPVNESIWEHMKLLYSGILFWGIIEYFLVKKYSLKENNFFFNLFICMISSIVIYLIVYLPLYNVFGENMIISISLLVIVIILEQVLSYFLAKTKDNKILLNKGAIFFIVLGYILFLYLTYNPPRNYIFFDILNNKYGIDIYK